MNFMESNYASIRNLVGKKSWHIIKNQAKICIKIFAFRRKITNLLYNYPKSANILLKFNLELRII